MRVEYKCTFERVNDVINRAKDDDREIEYIELTFAEWHAFFREMNADLPYVRSNPVFENFIVYRGVTIRKVLP